ncbi:hypothetical protein NHX12_020285 [Muraenolepis orangiensis]|uniref:Reverse transcriptase zinc-binding domain-containing protein n=1 Tax=Muraenolepis orangiensis TaxID=630683 RepID=A0A9Q0ERK7_9TELE|nr:hypothetical protein NHX12_020285 [Muraenolepis orangiensis]
MASSETPPPSLRQGVRIAPHDSSVSVEEALLAAGEQVGHGNLVFASRLLQKKRLELSSFLQERVKGALVRCRFLEIKEMDAPTPFFFNLERSVAQRKQMSCLKLPGGRVTSSPEEMRDHAMDFYTDLFGGEQCSIEGREEILEGLPQLSPEEKAALDLELTVEELTGAVNQMASGRAPGIDGLSGEFLKHFWAPPKLSAYADDVSIFVSSQRDVQCLQDTLSLYERASSAKVNWAKSSALLLGCWREQVVPSLPGGLQWETEGLKVLGVFLGTEAFKAKNWEGAKEKVCARLSKWKWLLPQMSYRGRVLVANTLVASTLWHRLMALTPPRNLVSSIQQEIVDFFWSSRHWVRAAALYLPLAEGGQGLISIQSKIASFRLRTVSRLLYDCGPSWLNFGKLLLRSVGRFGHKQLFLLNPEELDLSGLTPFYTSVLQAWHTFKFTRATSEMPGMWVFEEPLFFNGLLRARTLQSASLRTSLREAGCTKVGHLMKAKATSLEALRRRSNTSSIRILDQVVKEVCAALPESLRAFAEDADLCEQWIEDGDYSFPSLEVTPAVGDWHEGAGQLLTLRTPHLGTFQACGKKETYNLCVKVLNLRSLAGVKESRWAEFLGPDSSPKGSCRCLYKLPVEKRTADLQWRIVHGAIATNRYRAHLDPELGEGCIFCSEVETLEHLFVQCPRLSALFILLKSWFQGLGEEFSFILFIFGPKYSAKKKGVHTLLNFLSGAAKMAIWLTRRNRVQGVGSGARLPVLRGLLRARLRVEYTYYHLIDNIQAFSHMWAGVRIAPHDSSVSEEEALLAAREQVGHGGAGGSWRSRWVMEEQVGHGNLVVISKVNKAVVVFVKSEQIVHQLVASGVFVKDLYVQLMQKKRLELTSFLQESEKGALVRSRFLELKEMDAPTPFFFNLERSVAQRRQMSCLKLPG